MTDDEKFEELQDEYMFQAKLKLWLRAEIKKADKEMDRIKKELATL